jgi:hypothetical protein
MEPLIPGNIFGGAVILHNDSSFDMYNVVAKCSPLMTGDFAETNHLSMRGFVVGGPMIPVLSTGGNGSTIPCVFMNGQIPLAPMSHYLMTVYFEGDYGYSKLHYHIKTSFKYTAVVDANGKVVFQPS